MPPPVRKGANMTATPSSQLVIVVDFGAQYGQLIARRVRDLRVYSEIVPCDITAEEVRELAPAAIILSGGRPACTPRTRRPSTRASSSWHPRAGLLLRPADYGRHAGRHRGPHREGRVRAAPLTRRDEGASSLYGETPVEQTVWMSHRDAVVRGSPAASR